MCMKKTYISDPHFNMLSAHPYEQPAYEVYKLEDFWEFISYSKSAIWVRDSIGDMRTETLRCTRYAYMHACGPKELYMLKYRFGSGCRGDKSFSVSFLPFLCHDVREWRGLVWSVPIPHFRDSHYILSSEYENLNKQVSGTGNGQVAWYDLLWIEMSWNELNEIEQNGYFFITILRTLLYHWKNYRKIDKYVFFIFWSSSHMYLSC